MIKFYSKSKTHSELSNFHLDINGLTFNDQNFISGEHVFHYNKYMVASCVAMTCNEAERSNNLKKYASKFVGDYFKSPLDAKRAGSKTKGMTLTSEELKLWNNLAGNIQYQICHLKIKSDDKLKKLLMDTGDKYLIHQDNRANENTIWGAKVKKDTEDELIGENKLGKIWMHIRDT